MVLLGGCLATSPCDGPASIVSARIDDRGRVAARVCSHPCRDSACLSARCATGGTIVLDRSLDASDLADVRGSIDVTFDGGGTIRATFGG
jgi:hypothetical protein